MEGGGSETQEGAEATKKKQWLTTVAIRSRIFSDHLFKSRLPHTLLA
jgi:hypothetical protein